MIGDNGIAYASAGEIASRVRSKELSPVEVIEATIDLIDARNPSLNAIIFEGFEDARAAAVAAEKAVVAGDELGPLHGVPTLMKDLFDFKPGWPSTLGGVRALAEFIPDFYCIWAERMEAAGAIIVGKTNSPVMGFRGITDNPLFGATNNPFDTAKNPGGSSGGSAAAVADGLVPIAEGTDGGGSIRIPAAWCNVFGFQPSAGRVPFVNRPNAFSGASPFVYEGTLTRTVEDAAIAMTAISGYHPGDPFALTDAPDFTRGLGGSVEGWKIAYSPDLDVYPVDPVVAAAVEQAAHAFQEAGAEVVEVKLGLEVDQHDLSDLWCKLISPLNLETFSLFKANGLDLMGDHRDDFPHDYLAWLELVDKMPTMEYMAENANRTLVFDAIQGVLADHQLLLSPTNAALPVDNLTDGSRGETRGPTQINGVEVDPLIGWCMTYFTNFTGNPAASIPAGLSPDGLPIGMQMIGRRNADMDVFTAASVFERLRPWDAAYETCASRAL